MLPPWGWDKSKIRHHFPDCVFRPIPIGLMWTAVASISAYEPLSLPAFTSSLTCKCTTTRLRSTDLWLLFVYFRMCPVKKLDVKSMWQAPSQVCQPRCHRITNLLFFLFFFFHYIYQVMKSTRDHKIHNSVTIVKIIIVMYGSSTA